MLMRDDGSDPSVSDSIPGWRTFGFLSPAPRRMGSSVRTRERARLHCVSRAPGLRQPALRQRLRTGEMPDA